MRISDFDQQVVPVRVRAHCMRVAWRLAGGIAILTSPDGRIFPLSFECGGVGGEGWVRFLNVES